MNEWWAAHKSVFRFAGHSLLLHCRSWWLVGDFTGRCPGMNSQPAKAKFGRGDQVPSLCAHDTVLVALSDVPCHTVRCSTSLDTPQPSPSVVRTVSVIWSPRCIFDRFVCWPLVSEYFDLVVGELQSCLLLQLNQSPCYSAWQEEETADLPCFSHWW